MQAAIAAVSEAVKVAALAPPVPSLEIAAIASVGMVRDDGAATPARTVATFVVLRTEADTVPRIAMTGVANVFMVVEFVRACRMTV